MPYNAPLRNAVRQCYCGHALTSHISPAFMPSILSSQLTTGTIPGGVFSGGTAYFKLTYRIAGVGETNALSATSEKSQIYTANTIPFVQFTIPIPGATSIGIYATSNVSGSETLQVAYALPVPFDPGNLQTVYWQYPVSGLIGGASPPTTNTAAIQDCLECSDTHPFAPNVEQFVKPSVLGSGR